MALINVSSDPQPGDAGYYDWHDRVATSHNQLKVALDAAANGDLLGADANGDIQKIPSSTFNRRIVLRPQEYGAVGDGVADDTTALTNWWDALANDPDGTWAGFVPVGTYRVTSPRAFRIVAGHDGVVVDGAGAENAIIKYEYNVDEADNFLFFHDRVADGQVQRVWIQHLGFHGPGGTSTDHGKFFRLYDDSGGSGKFSLVNCLTQDFREGIRNDGSKNGDDWHIERHRSLDVLDFFVLNNRQSVIHDFYGCNIVSTTGEAGSVIKLEGGGGLVNYFGGQVFVRGTAAVLHKASSVVSGDYGYPNSFFTFHGTKGELHDSSVLIKNDTATGPLSFRLKGAQMPLTSGTATRTIATVRQTDSLIVEGGLIQGGVELDPADNSQEVPRLYVRDAFWLDKSITNIGDTTERNSPTIRHYPLEEGVATEESGAISQLGWGRYQTRNAKRILFSRGTSVSAVPELPQGGNTAESITVPEGAYITAIRLVILDDHAGADGTFIVENGDGTKTHISQSYASGNTALVNEQDTRLTLPHVSGVDATVALRANGIDRHFEGYVEVEYV